MTLRSRSTSRSAASRPVTSRRGNAQPRGPGPPDGGGTFASLQQGLVDVLGSLALFKGISRTNLSRIAAQMRRRRFSTGTTIYRQGDPAREFFVLTAGRIEVTVEGSDPEVPAVAVINAPHWFGELAVLTGPTRFVTITASNECEAWALSRDRFEACVDRHPVIYRNLIDSLSVQIQRKYRDLVDQSSLAIERARLVGDLQQRNAELAALADITRGVSESLDLDPTLQTISTHAAQLTRSDAACIFLYDQERGAFSIRASYNTAEQYLRETGDRRLPFEGTASPGSPSSRSLVVQSATERLPVQIADVAATRDYPSRDLLLRCGYRGVLVVPLLDGERVIGALSVLRNRPGEFSPREVELVTTFASHSAIALEHARLFQEIQARNRDLVEALEQQTVTAEFLKGISRSTFDLQLVLESLVKSATRLCGADSGIIFRQDGDAYRLAVDHGPPEQLRQMLRQAPIPPGRGTLVGRTALQRRAVHILDVLADPEYQWAEGQRVGGYRTVLGVPLLRDGIPIGVIALGRNAVRPFTEKQIQLLTTFADQAIIAIENVRLFNELQTRSEELTRSVEELRVIARTTQAVSSSLDLGVVLCTIAEQASRLCDADASLITEYVEAAGEFRPSASWNVRQEIVRAIAAAPPTWGLGATGRSAATGAPVQIPDVMSEAGYPFRELLAQEGYRAVLSIPLIRNAQTLGTLTVARRIAGPFSPRHVALLTTFANQTTIAIEHARLFRQQAEWNRTLEQRVAAQLAELERVSRLKRFLAPQLAEVIVASGDEEKLLESHRREITVVFCDLRGFTAFSETAEPDEVMGVLREYHTTMGALIFRFEGTLERFAGDGLMVFFNDPIPCADPPARAVRMGVEMRERVSDLTNTWRKRGHELAFGVGIALGDATLGRIGFEGRFDYGAIGPVTNLASRLCHEARGGQILISQRVYAAVEGIVDAKAVGELALKGFHRPLTAYNILRLKV